MKRSWQRSCCIPKASVSWVLEDIDSFVKKWRFVVTRCHVVVPVVMQWRILVFSWSPYYVIVSLKLVLLCHSYLSDVHFTYWNQLLHCLVLPRCLLHGANSLFKLGVIVDMSYYSMFTSAVTLLVGRRIIVLWITTSHFAQPLLQGSILWCCS